MGSKALMAMQRAGDKISNRVFQRGKGERNKLVNGAR